jgi:glutamate-1-semialdehyde 2,1-aminomutase
MSKWLDATKIIPGGNGLLSKRPQRYVSKQAIDVWPAYYDYAQGIFIRANNSQYVDMAQMGIGTAILGYAHKEVDSFVINTIRTGINTTLNSHLEPALAELLINLDPELNQVKFARTGGEAAAIAIRLARAATGRSKIMFSGYHGWHDWYIAANVSGASDALSDHLLPGLSSAGVPRELAGTSLPFTYNDSQSFRDVLNANPDVGTIILEGARYDRPSDEFLECIQQEAHARGIVIILDEITSGFRVCLGGSYLKRSFRPDVVLYGKALGNGYAISAVVGRSSVMEHANHTFISSTFWTEAVGFAAGIKTLELLSKENFVKLSIYGSQIADIWNRCADYAGIKLHTTEFLPLITFKLDHGRINEALYAEFSLSMLDRMFIASNSIYVSFAHTSHEHILHEYEEAVRRSFLIMASRIEALESLSDVGLSAASRSDGFRRLT